jgi:hypothetical protein
MNVNQNLMLKLLCIAFVAAVMLPMGHMLFPYVSGMLNTLQFQMLEAVISTALGFGLSLLFG